MSSVATKHVRLGLANLAVKKSDKSVEVESVRQRNSIDPVTRKPTDVLEVYNINFYAVSGSIQTVKLGLDMQHVIEKIESALNAGSIVRVNFGSPSTLEARFYAMLNNGVLIQGVTAKASTVEIVEINEPDNEDFEIEL